MAIEISFDETYDPDEPDRPTWGRYHASIIRVDEEGGKRGEMIVDFEILAGDPGGQEGKVHRDYFSKTVKAFRRIHSLAMACGMITAAELKEMKARGEPAVYEFERDAIGKQIFIELEKDVYQDRERAKLGFAIYHPLDKKVQNWPKNKAMLANAGFDVSGISSPLPATAAAAQPQPGGQSPAAAPPDAGETLGDMFEDLF